MEDRRRVPLPRHWIGKMSCGGRSSAMERVKEAGTPNLVGQEEEPLPPTTVGVSTQNEAATGASSHCGKKLDPQSRGVWHTVAY